MNIIVQQPSSNVIIYSIIGAFIIVFSVYLWGDYQVKIYDENPNEILTASLIHTSINQKEKWNPKFRTKIMDHYRELTLQAYKANPNIIIWPETALPAELGTDPEIDLSVKNLVRETGTPLLFGCASYAKMEKWGIKVRRHKNSAYLIDKEGNILGTYHKMRLVPFYEYLPFEGRFSWPKWLVPEHGIDLPGNVPTVFKLLNWRFGVVICWESWFPNLFRRFVKDGAKFMINLINEAPYGNTLPSRQTMFMSVFRAVENRVSLLRCANTGITALIDPFGRIKGKVKDGKGEDILATGILTVSVPEGMGPTFYTRHGDIFALACVMVTVLCMVTALLPVRLRMSLKILKVL
jgi:apolipoprotein N-acyltransferase